LDRLTILEIKQSKITSADKLAEIQKEIGALHEFVPFKTTFAFQYKLLFYTNLRVWDFMDIVNATSMDKRNTIEFAELAAKVYDYNDQRFRIKRLLNTMANSELKEQKSYGNHHVLVSVRDVDHCIPVINYLSVRYDSVSFLSDSVDRLQSIFVTPNFIYEPVDSSCSVDADSFVLPDRDAYEFIPVTYLASGLLGDFIHQLSVVSEHHRTTGRKGIVYMTEEYEIFRMGLQKTCSDISPFLLKQPYIHDIKIHAGETCDINLSSWRDTVDFKTDSWYTVFKRSYNISWSKTPWFHSKGNPEYANTVFISTSHLRWWEAPFDHAKLIERLGPDVRFLAFQHSMYYDFVARTGLHIPLVLAPTFSEIVDAIAGCKLFVGTLSSPLSVADALHKRRFALQKEDSDALIALRTNPSFITYTTNLDTIQ
jgi:hypothetical protein